MAKSTKSYEERMLEMEKKEQESLEKAKRYAAQKKELLKRKKAEESKKRTHRLCQVGGAVESVLGAPIEEVPSTGITRTAVVFWLTMPMAASSAMMPEMVAAVVSRSEERRVGKEC